MPKQELTFKLHASKPFRNYGKGEPIGSLCLMFNLQLRSWRWHWWGWETEWNTYEGDGFATFDEAIRDFALKSHPEPIEFDGLE